MSRYIFPIKSYIKAGDLARSPYVTAHFSAPIHFEAFRLWLATCAANSPSIGMNLVINEAGQPGQINVPSDTKDFEVTCYTGTGAKWILRLPGMKPSVDPLILTSVCEMIHPSTGDPLTRLEVTSQKLNDVSIL